jgi:mRNA interferase RelE/StbE
LKAEFKTSFVKDLERVRDALLRNRIRETIEQVERAPSFQEVENVKKLRGGERFYRIRIGDYRIGLTLEGDTAIFVRCLHRRDLYRHFP